jgi:DNA-binding transcriptional regulator LsrR (DeoR family)
LRPQRDPEQLARAAQLYFVEERPQDEVAEVLRTTRSNVSRMLKQAREQGIVRIVVEFPTRRAEGAEHALVERFGLTAARVLQVTSDDDPLPGVGRLAAGWLLEQLGDGQVLALGWGVTLQHVVNALDDDPDAGGLPHDVEIAQLIGGLSAIATATTGQELAREFARRLGARWRYLHAPAVFASAQRLATMLAEPSISEALAKARAADIAMVGLGDPNTGSLAAWFGELGLTPAERAAIAAEGAVGDVCGRFYDRDGRELSTPISDRVLSLGLDALRAIPITAAVACTVAKAPSILGALRGGLIDVLVTDEHAARRVLELDAELPPVHR